MIQQDPVDYVVAFGPYIIISLIVYLIMQIGKLLWSRRNKNKIVAFFLLIASFSVYNAEAATMIDINKIISIESGGDPMAHNKRTNARGLCQITPICLADYNIRNKTAYDEVDLYDATLNRTIAEWYLNKRIPSMLKYFKREVTVDNILISYNAGIKYVVDNRKLPAETKRYIKKYNEAW